MLLCYSPLLSDYIFGKTATAEDAPDKTKYDEADSRGRQAFARDQSRLQALRIWPFTGVSLDRVGVQELNVRYPSLLTHASSLP